MPALPQRLRYKLAAAMTELREFGAACGDFEQGAARPCNGASQQVHKHPWSTKTHTLAKRFLPGPIGDLLGDDGLAYGHHLMDQAPMETLAMGGEFPLTGGLASPDGQVAFG